MAAIKPDTVRIVSSFFILSFHRVADLSPKSPCPHGSLLSPIQHILYYQIHTYMTIKFYT